MPLLGLRPDVRRVPVFGLGCVAGAAGVARVHDLLRGDPDGVAVLLSVELCSLTVQRDDASMANLVGSGLFGDGAAAVVMVGERRAAALGLTRAARGRLPQPAVPGHRAGDGLGRRRAAASGSCSAAGVPEVVEEHLGGDLAAFLGDHDLKIGDVVTWVAHPGGPKVLEAMAARAGPAADGLAPDLGLAGPGRQPVVVLGAARPRRHPGRRAAARPGSPGVLLAMGPGFCSELVLLRW